MEHKIINCEWCDRDLIAFVARPDEGFDWGPMVTVGSWRSVAPASCAEFYPGRGGRASREKQNEGVALHEARPL